MPPFYHVKKLALRCPLEDSPLMFHWPELGCTVILRMADPLSHMGRAHYHILEQNWVLSARKRVEKWVDNQ